MTWQTDAADPLAPYRALFFNAEPELIYLDGNSLGRMPRKTLIDVNDLLVNGWGTRLVRGWGEGWLEEPAELGDLIGTLIGADPGETLVCDSTTVNLFKLACAALAARPSRSKIITDRLNFPSDLYVLQGLVRHFGDRNRIVYAESPDGIHGANILDHLDSDTALVTLSHTAFKSGFVYDMVTISRAASERGALTLWDLSHSVGAVPVDLRGSGADMAVGCTYKYLNGGPGAPAFLWVRKELQDELLPPIQGWFGSQTPFQFNQEFACAKGIQRMQIGTPSIVSLKAARPGIEICAQAGIAPIRQKSLLMGEFLRELWTRHLKDLGVTWNSPTDATQRGSHVSFGHPEALRLDLSLIHDHGVIPDFRAPDNIRFGFAPLYNTFTDLETGVLALEEILVSQSFTKWDATTALTVT